MIHSLTYSAVNLRISVNLLNKLYQKTHWLKYPLNLIFCLPDVVKAIIHLDRLSKRRLRKIKINSNSMLSLEIMVHHLSQVLLMNRKKIGELASTGPSPKTCVMP